MNQEERQDRISDPILSAAMAELRGEVPHDVDWDKLRCSITGSAELTLARKRVTRRILLPKSLVPLAAAATIAFSLWMGPTMLERIREPAAVQTAAQLSDEAVIEHALGSDLTEHEFRLLVTGRADPDGMLAFAIADQ